MTGILFFVLILAAVLSITLAKTTHSSEDGELVQSKKFYGVSRVEAEGRKKSSSSSSSSSSKSKPSKSSTAKKVAKKLSSKKKKNKKSKFGDDQDDQAQSTCESGEDCDADSTCFEKSATVELQSGEVKRMDSLSVGDTVKVGAREYSPVFCFTHKTADVQSWFVKIETQTGHAISLTPGHYIYANGVLVAAGEVRVGDVLQLGDGTTSVVKRIGRETGEGLYNPQTVNGNVVVNGIQASTYTTAVEPSFAHALLAPLRSAFKVFGFATDALENGSPIARVLPNGAAAVF